VLGAISIGLVNYGDQVAQVGGLVFSTASVFLMFYALVKFHERGNRLGRREKGLYDDKTGAFIAVSVVFGAVGLTFALKLAF